MGRRKDEWDLGRNEFPRREPRIADENDVDSFIQVRGSVIQFRVLAAGQALGIQECERVLFPRIRETGYRVHDDFIGRNDTRRHPHPRTRS